MRPPRSSSCFLTSAIAAFSCSTLCSSCSLLSLWKAGEFVSKAHFERSDITFVPSCAVVGEAMVALVLAEAVLEKFGGDHIEETKRNWRSYMTTTSPRAK